MLWPQLIPAYQVLLASYLSTLVSILKPEIGHQQQPIAIPQQQNENHSLKILIWICWSLCCFFSVSLSCFWWDSQSSVRWLTNQIKLSWVVAILFYYFKCVCVCVLCDLLIRTSLLDMQEKYRDTLQLDFLLSEIVWNVIKVRKTWRRHNCGSIRS